MNSRLRYGIITCFDPNDRQFRGIYDICRRMGKHPEASHGVWQKPERPAAFRTVRNGRGAGPQSAYLKRRGNHAGRLDLSGCRELQWVALSGHGEEDMPRMSNGGDPRERVLDPGDLLLGTQTRLYLLACFQGRTPIRRGWADGTGVPLENIFGCAAETETAVSTLFFLNLAEHGYGNIAHWFQRWCEVNAGLRPYFPEMRLIYRHNGGDFLETLAALGRRIDLTPYGDFLEAGRRNPSCVSGLI